MKTVKKIEDSQLWQWTAQIAQQGYEALDILPEDEKWGIGIRMKRHAFDATAAVAEAIGSVDPRDTKWHFSHARQSLFGLKNALQIAIKLGFLHPTERLLQLIDKSVEEIDRQLAVASEDIPKWLREMQMPPSAPDKKD